MNEVARHFLETYARGSEVDGGWLFAKAIQQAQLDYSDRSLGRLDQLLAAIRARAKPSREALQETLPGSNFCSLIAYYVIEVVRRRTGANIDWHDRASALRVLPAGVQLPDAPFARIIANSLDQGAAFMPLGWVESQVLGDGRLVGAGDYVASLIAQLERDGPVVWWTGMHALGSIASWQMMMAADGGAVLPMMLSSTAPKTWVALMAGLPGEDINEALDRGARSLDENRDGSIWQVLAYDGFMDIEGERLDAVMVILQTYGKLPLKLKIAFPYRPARDGRAFAILAPRLREANVENDKVAMLNSAMERGIQSIKWAFGTTWDQLREVEGQSHDVKRPATEVPVITNQEDNRQGSGLGFAPGTLVHTIEGLKPIERIQVGDLVLSHPQNEPPPPRRRKKREYTYRKVTKVSVADHQPIVLVTCCNDADAIEETLRVANTHPIWSKVGNWVAADQLNFGHALVLSFNGNALVTKTGRGAQTARVYTLEVEEFQTFYVGQLGVWVHCDRSVAKQSYATPQPAPAVDFTKPQRLLEIADYYNDTLAEPPAPVALPLEQADKLRKAAEQTRSVMLEHAKIELCYDLESIRWLTGYIDRMRIQGNPQDRLGQTNMLGAYLGECIIRNIGGEWASYNNLICVRFDDEDAVFPFNKVARQFENGAEGGDSILGFYDSTVAMRALSRPLKAAQERLMMFYKRGNNRIFIPSNMDGTIQWAAVKEIKDRWVTIQQMTVTVPSISVALTQVASFYVCAPDGKLIHQEWIDKAYFDSLPEEILRQIKCSLPTDTSLTLDQTESGKKFVAIEYKESATKKEGHYYYATSLRNISSQKIKILKFGGLRFNGSVWTLASVTGNYYSADDFKDWYQQKGEWLLPGETACDSANWGNPPVLWAYYGIAESGESFIAGKCLEQPFDDLAGQQATGMHYVSPMPPQPKMEQAIVKLRNAYAQTQKKLNPATLASICASTPPWMNKTDALSEILKQQTLLYKEGVIVWGALIQANKLLFSPGRDDCPALLVYSSDTYFDARPQELRLIGQKIFSLKDTSPSDPELKNVAQLVSDEMGRSMGFKLPRVFSNRDIRAATFMVFRKHIPNGVLSAGLFPLLIHPSTEAVMIGPSEFWPIEMIIMWKEGKL